MSSAAAFAKTAPVGRRLKSFLPLALVLFAGGAAAWSLPGMGQSEEELLPPEKAFALEVRPSAPDQITLTVTPAKGYYVYQQKTWVALKGGAGARLGPLTWLDKPVQKKDATFGLTPVFERQARATLQVTRPKGAGKLDLVVGTQGCNEPRGVCYPPQQTTLSVNLP